MSESEPTQIGDIIRQRRAELGLSPAELGELVGRTGSTVRRWEKNDAVPPDSVLAVLATALQLEREQLKAPAKSLGEMNAPPGRAPRPEAQAPEPRTKPPEPTAMQQGPKAALHTDAPEPTAKTTEPEAETTEPEANTGPPPISSPPPVRRPASTQPEVSATPMSEDRPPSAPPRSAPPPQPNKQPPSQPLPPSGVGAHTPAAPPGTGGEPITELPTEVMAVPSAEPTREPAAAARPARTRTIPRQKEDALSYVEDPKQRYRYFLRWLLTAVAIVVMLFVLAWAFTELREALGDVWDLFQQEPSETTIVGADLSGG